MKFLSALTLVATLMIAPFVAWAAGGDGPSDENESPDSPLGQAIVDVKAGNFDAAIDKLRALLADDPDNADGWNYLGYSLRNKNQLDDSLNAYQRALAINESHRGAREYLGELYLMMGKVDLAKEQLAILDDLCLFGCSEYTTLKEAIEKHES